jgi:hypothetical protein
MDEFIDLRQGRLKNDSIRRFGRNVAVLTKSHAHRCRLHRRSIVDSISYEHCFRKLRFRLDDRYFLFRALARKNLRDANLACKVAYFGFPISRQEQYPVHLVAWTEMSNERSTLLAGCIAKAQHCCVITIHEQDAFHPRRGGRQLGSETFAQRYDLFSSRDLQMLSVDNSVQSLAGPFADFRDCRERDPPRFAAFVIVEASGCLEYCSRLATIFKTCSRVWPGAQITSVNEGRP